MAYIDVERYSFPTLHQKELNDYMKGWNACLKSVLQQPTADVVEVKHGKWIDKEYHIWGDKYICSVCGFTVPKKYKNCPECISRMDGENKTEDPCKGCSCLEPSGMCVRMGPCHRK